LVLFTWCRLAEPGRGCGNSDGMHRACACSWCALSLSCGLCVRGCLCAYASEHAHMHAHSHARARARARTHTHTHTHTHARTHARAHAHTIWACISKESSSWSRRACSRARAHARSSSRPSPIGEPAVGGQTRISCCTPRRRLCSLSNCIRCSAAADMAGDAACGGGVAPVSIYRLRVRG